MPLVPYNAFETDFRTDSFPPYPPSSSARHYLGTDTTGRDIVARLVYGFRLAMAFALILLTCNYLVGITLGGAMGYVGRWFDLTFQRLIEVWSNVPFLYVIMIMASVIAPNFWTLVAVMVIFGWMEMTWYMRTSTYREKAREYVVAARALGASAPQDPVPAHPAELGVDHRHVHPVLRRERRDGVDGARLPGLRLTAADAELG